ncbi:MAG: hypothetical protein JXA71_01680 [Chitinispirillaceae bacterium]|nr:hypothetical protein [Chitinispirillaceae bacterium]
MSFGLILFTIFAAAVQIALCTLLLEICRRKETDTNSRLILFLSKLDIPLDRFGLELFIHIIIVGALGLFLEMLLIRWVSSELSLLGYFKNAVLIACYLGFGLGCYLSKRKIHLSCMAFSLPVVSIAIGSSWPAISIVRNLMVAIVGSVSTHHLAGDQAASPGALEFALVAAALFFFVIPFFLLIIFMFVPIGQMTGALLERAGNGISAYSVNVAAGLAGILIFALLCFANQPPPVWCGLAGVFTVILVLKIPLWRWMFIALFTMVILATFHASNPPVTTYWSPYQKLQVTPRYNAGEVVSYSLTTNNSWNQQVVDLSDSFVKAHPAFFGKLGKEFNLYNLPYRFVEKPASVLILGAGMGNDAAAAIRNGAGRVTAVEIDPLIVSLGKKLHFERPYDDPRVNVVIDDARSFIQRSKDTYSLIVFALLDAQTTCSNYSNVRIDNYAYTREALMAAKALLAPDGIFVIKFQIDNTHWIAGRLEQLVQEVFNQEPMQLQTGAGSYITGGRLFIAGSRQRISNALRDVSFQEFQRTHSNSVLSKALVTTDDWPFFYQRSPGIPSGVLVFSLILFITAWLLFRRLHLSTGKIFQWHFFFLGAGFMLLEVQGVSKMALLFGTTWMVNAIVVGAVLILIILANIFAGKFKHFPVALAYGGIGTAILVAYLVPLRMISMESLWLKAILASILLLAPVFFASIVFIRSFARANFSGNALGSNLLGAIAGGLLESLSLWTGLRSLLVVACAMYLLSLVFLRQKSEAGLKAPGAEISSTGSR